MSHTTQIACRYPQDVADFALAHGITDKLDLVVEAVNLTFPEAQSLTVEIEEDPESDHRCIMVDALVQGNARDVHLRHQDCVRRLLKLLQWPTSTLIRTTYSLA
jgi:hypothetical protein